MSWGLDGCARWRRPAQGPWQGAGVKLSLELFAKEFKELGGNIELGLGWLRAVAASGARPLARRGSKMKLKSSF